MRTPRQKNLTKFNLQLTLDCDVEVEAAALFLLALSGTVMRLLKAVLPDYANFSLVLYALSKSFTMISLSAFSCSIYFRALPALR